MTNEQFCALDNFKKLRKRKSKKMNAAKEIWDRIKPKIQKQDD